MEIAKQSMLMFLVLTVLTGVLYPLGITAIAQLAFPYQANGSLIVQRSTGQIIGSELLGQEFKDSKYFWSRPSATSPYQYNAGASSGSNLGPTNPDLLKTVKSRAESLRAVHGSALVPVDLVTSSASGLDPHISRAASYYQEARVAKARGMSQAQVHEMINACTSGRQLGFLGEEVVNVVRLNLLLDEKQK